MSEGTRPRSAPPGPWQKHALKKHLKTLFCRTKATSSSKTIVILSGGAQPGVEEPSLSKAEGICFPPRLPLRSLWPFAISNIAATKPTLAQKLRVKPQNPPNSTQLTEKTG